MLRRRDLRRRRRGTKPAADGSRPCRSRIRKRSQVRRPASRARGPRAYVPGPHPARPGHGRPRQHPLHGAPPSQTSPSDFVPVIVLTSDTSRPGCRAALEAGACEFLTKPIEDAELLLRVRNLSSIRYCHQELKNTNMALANELRARTRIDDREAADFDHRAHMIRRIIERGGPTMVFQPIVELSSGTTVGVEALARFGTEPRRGPDQWFADAASSVWARSSSSRRSRRHPATPGHRSELRARGRTSLPPRCSRPSSRRSPNRCHSIGWPSRSPSISRSTTTSLLGNVAMGSARPGRAPGGGRRGRRIREPATHPQSSSRM